MPFRLLKKIGEGRFASIYKIEDEKGNQYAFKAVPPNKLKYIELDILSRLKCPYIIKTIDPKITSINGEKGIVIELKEYNLTKLNTKDLPYVQLKRIIISAIYGIICMHKKNYLHLDISRSNILYDVSPEGNYTSYLTDFGWSVKCDNAYKGIISTKIIKYKNTPVEALVSMKETKMRKYSDKSDIWSLGIVILELLGTRFRLDDTDIYIKHLENINDSFIEEKIRLYNNNKMSANEELKLKELLLNMLKINTDDRISSKDITKLNFFNNNNKILIFNEECVLNKPKELVFMPYISPLTKKGLLKIREYYLNNSKIYNITIEEYFLCIQTFLRLMSKTIILLTEDELNHIIDKSINLAANYNDRINNKASYKISEELNLEVGYNFYNCSDYLDDLIILNNYIFNFNSDLLGFYNLLDIKKLFIIFREKYNYQYLKRNSIKLNHFLELGMPSSIETDEVNFIKAVDYHEIFEDDNKNSLIVKYKNIEKNFRTDIIDFFENRIIKAYEDDDIDIINIVDRMLNKNDKIKIIAKNISKTIQNINEFFDYGIINIDIYNKINDNMIDNKKYILVNDNKKYSLLIKNNKKYIHYYSEKNDNLKKFLNDNGYDYENNFTYGVNTCCQVLEICLIFIIYYNLKTKEKDYHIKCLEYDTIKSIILATLV
jgi:serine/threonine protein kinase